MGIPVQWRLFKNLIEQFSVKDRGMHTYIRQRTCLQSLHQFWQWKMWQADQFCSDKVTLRLFLRVVFIKIRNFKLTWTYSKWASTYYSNWHKNNYKLRPNHFKLITKLGQNHSLQVNFKFSIIMLSVLIIGLEKLFDFFF